MRVWIVLVVLAIVECNLATPEPEDEDVTLTSDISEASPDAQIVMTSSEPAAQKTMTSLENAMTTPSSSHDHNTIKNRGKNRKKLHNHHQRNKNKHKKPGTDVDTDDDSWYDLYDEEIDGEEKVDPEPVEPKEIVDTEPPTMEEITNDNLNKPILDSLTQPYEIIFPTQIRRNGEHIGLSTRDKKSRHKTDHYENVILQLPMFGKKHKIKLQLNTGLLSHVLKQKYFQDEHQIIREGVEHCYYHGKVKKVNISHVALSTCKGIRGLLQIDDETFIILPLPSGRDTLHHPHVVFRTSPSKKRHCANTATGFWAPYSKLHEYDYLRILKKNNMNKRLTRETSDEVKHIKLALVMDHDMYTNRNSSQEELLEYTVQVANILDMYFKQMNTRIALVYVEMWNKENQMSVTTRIREVLHNFLDYKKKLSGLVKYDIAHFVTGREFLGDDVGMAIPDSVCTDRAVAVSQDSNIHEPQQLAGTLTHLIGHNLGIQDDDAACHCDDQSGCFMSGNIKGESSHSPRMFSSCSKEHWKLAVETGLTFCLYDTPKKESFRQECGNGEVERGEECDCTTQDECDSIDPCCDASTCLLKSYSTCRSGPCCHNCTVLSRAYECRAKSSECDVPEFCDGRSGYCPGNSYKQDGQMCSSNDGYCYRGQCRSHSNQCQKTWGSEADNSDVKCYERHNPTGTLMGHCGIDMKTNQKIHCDIRNVGCGMLHCQGGDKYPAWGSHTSFSDTRFGADGKEFQCKVMNGPISESLSVQGLVEDGTKCGEGMVCMNQVCTDATLVFTAEECPTGSNNETCSGRGVCTNTLECFCDPGWTGMTCGEVQNITMTTVTKPPTRKATLPNYWVILDAAMTTVPPHQPTNMTPVGALDMAQKEAISTMWLLVILGSVVGILVIALGLSMLCYRRKNPLTIFDKKNLFGKKESMKSREDEESSEEANANRIISFGNMPSYRKDKRNMWKKKRRMDGEASESEQENEILSHPKDLSMQPEKGILKKTPRSVDDLKRLCAPAKPAPKQFATMPAKTSDIVRPNTLDAIKPFVLDSKSNSNRNSTSSPVDRTELEDLSQSDNEIINTPDSYSIIPGRMSPGFKDDNQSLRSVGSRLSSNGSRHSSRPSSHHGSSHSSKDHLDSPRTTRNNIEQEEPLLKQKSTSSSRIVKLRNLDDLLKEIDSQTLDVSPKYDEPCSSDAEADRQFPRNSFYKQDDDFSASILGNKPSNLMNITNNPMEDVKLYNKPPSPQDFKQLGKPQIKHRQMDNLGLLPFEHSPEESDSFNLNQSPDIFPNPHQREPDAQSSQSDSLEKRSHDLGYHSNTPSVLGDQLMDPDSYIIREIPISNSVNSFTRRNSYSKATHGSVEALPM
ncbi:unnamed protein product [Owenia fusiformis]|uniref:Uncharacterized protein n=1 Tax=Owenia fusiformis TaxID=6347 RepID=A0A8J1UGN3_OWEFU|nr:unnamed protein product [Owenia fusiformis]